MEQCRRFNRADEQLVCSAGAVNLLNAGFKLFKFKVKNFQELEHEILFTRKGIVSQEVIDLEEVWDLNNKNIQL